MPRVGVTAGPRTTGHSHSISPAVRPGPGRRLYEAGAEGWRRAEKAALAQAGAYKRALARYRNIDIARFSFTKVDGERARSRALQWHSLV